MTLASFSPAALEDARLLELAARCEFQLGEEAEFSHAASGEIALRLRDGRTLHHRAPHALGEPARPLSDSALRTKFIDCVSRAAHPVGPARASQFVERVLALDHESDAAAALCSIAAAGFNGRQAGGGLPEARLDPPGSVRS